MRPAGVLAAVQTQMPASSSLSRRSVRLLQPAPRRDAARSRGLAARRDPVENHGHRHRGAGAPLGRPVAARSQRGGRRRPVRCNRPMPPCRLPMPRATTMRAGAPRARKQRARADPSQSLSETVATLKKLLGMPLTGKPRAGTDRRASVTARVTSGRCSSTHRNSEKRDQSRRRGFRRTGQKRNGLQRRHGAAPALGRSV